MIDDRTVLPVLLVLLGIGCTSAIAAHQPLSDAAVAQVNEAIGGRQASVVLLDEHERAVRGAKLEVCQSAPGKGTLRSGERCLFTHECECGLICQSDRCRGTSLKLSEPEPVEVKDVKVGRDTTQWLEFRSGTENEWRQRAVPTAALERVLLRHRGRGALEGLGIGLLAGAAAGALIGFASGDDKCTPGFGGCLFVFTAKQKAAFAAIGLGALGLISGAILGAAIGHRTTVEFDSP